MVPAMFYNIGHRRVSDQVCARLLPNDRLWTDQSCKNFDGRLSTAVSFHKSTPMCCAWYLTQIKLSAEIGIDSEKGRTSIWEPTALTMGRMTMAPTVWLMKVVATSTKAQKMAKTAHSPCTPTHADILG